MHGNLLVIKQLLKWKNEKKNTLNVNEFKNESGDFYI